MRSTTRRCRHLLLCSALAAAIGACSPDVEDGLGPQVPIPNVTGSALRAEQPADGLDVEIEDAETGETAAATVTVGGQFGFAEIPAGRWEIKVSGADAGDFDSVSRVFELDSADPLQPPLEFDVWAFGCQSLAPAAGVRLPRPNVFAPLTFRWVNPSGGRVELDGVRVFVYTAAGDRIWTSEKLVAAELSWNGVANAGDLAGQAVPAGDYYWRLRVDFVDSLEARLDPQAMVFE